MAGALVLGFGLVAARAFLHEEQPGAVSSRLNGLIAIACGGLLVFGTVPVVQGHLTLAAGGMVNPATGLFVAGAPAVSIATIVAIPAFFFTFFAARQLIAGMTAGAVKG